MTTDTGQLDKLIKRVQHLIAKADSTQDQFPEEAASFREKAEALMFQYRIEESMLAAAAPVGTGLMPVWAVWNICPLVNEFRDQYQQMASSIVQHVGAQAVYTMANVDDVTWRVMRVVGYESDLRYGEMLYTSARLAFGEHLEPSYNSNESDQANAYRMRHAGMEGWRIAYVLWGKKLELINTPAGVGRNAGKARRLYKAEAIARGEDPEMLMGQGMNVKTWRSSYADGFVQEIYMRLLRMRYDKGEESQTLILAGRSEAVREAFYTEYPQFRPQPRAGSLTTGRDSCPRCARAKSGYCRDHAYLKPSYAQGGEKKINHRAFNRGSDAATTVDLGTKRRLT